MVSPRSFTNLHLIRTKQTELDTVRSGQQGVAGSVLTTAWTLSSSDEPLRKKTEFPSLSPPGAICPIFKLSCTISNLFTSQSHVISKINGSIMSLLHSPFVQSQHRTLARCPISRAEHLFIISSVFPTCSS